MNQKKTPGMKLFINAILYGMVFILAPISKAQDSNTIFATEIIENENSISIKINTIDNNGPYYYVLRDKQAFLGGKVISYSDKTRAKSYTFENLKLESYNVCVRNNEGKSNCVTIDLSKYQQTQKK